MHYPMPFSTKVTASGAAWQAVAMAGISTKVQKTLKSTFISLHNDALQTLKLRRGLLRFSLGSCCKMFGLSKLLLT